MSVPITKPTVDGSNGTWGTELNTVLDALNASDRFAYKAGDTSRSSTTTATADPDLTFTLPVGTHVITTLLLASGAAAGDFKSGWSFGGTATGARAGQGPGATSASSLVGAVVRQAGASDTGATFTTGAIYGVDGTNWSAVIETGFLVVTVAGTFAVVWAQGTSSGTATILRTGSYVHARQVA